MPEFAIQDSQRVVFIGDSITDCGRQGDQAPYGSGYVRLAIDLITARYPERQIQYLNRGISGNTVQDLHRRWQQDVIAHRPDWLCVKIGINDLHRTLDRSPQPVPPELFERLYRECLDSAKSDSSARLVLIDPFYISRETDPATREGQVLALLPGYLEAVHRLAAEFGTLSVLTHEAFQRQLQFRPAREFCPEPVHPFLSGHLVIAHELLRSLGW